METFEGIEVDCKSNGCYISADCIVVAEYSMSF